MTSLVTKIFWNEGGLVFFVIVVTVFMVNQYLTLTNPAIYVPFRTLIQRDDVVPLF